MSEDTLQKIKETYGEEFMLTFKEETAMEDTTWIDNHLKTLLKRFQNKDDFHAFIPYFIEVLKAEDKTMINASFMASHMKKFSMQLCQNKDDAQTIEKEAEEDELEEDFLDNESVLLKINEMQDTLNYIRNDVQEGFYDVGEIKLDSSTTSEKLQTTLLDISDVKELLHTLKNTKSKRPRSAEYNQVQEIERLLKEKQKDTATGKKEEMKAILTKQLPFIGMIVGCLLVLLLFLVWMKL